MVATQIYGPYQMLTLVFLNYLEGNTGGFALENPNCLQATSASAWSQPCLHIGFPPTNKLPDEQFPLIKQRSPLQKHLFSPLQYFCLLENDG